MRRLAILFWTLLLLSAQAYADGVFRYREVAEPTSLDWAGDRVSYEITILINIMEGLVKLDDQFHPLPALAERWEVTPDGLTYRFHLRPGVKWTDGKTLQAQDFVFAWRRVLSPKTASAGAAYLFDVEGAEEFHRGKLKDVAKVGVKAVDSQTLEVYLRRASPNFLQRLYYFLTFPQREDLVKKGADWWHPPQLVTLGPYRIREWVAGKHIELVRNPTYYGQAKGLSQSRFVVEPDEEKARELVATNQIDLLFLPTTSDVTRFTIDAKRPWQLKQYEGLNTSYLGFNFESQDLVNLHLRKAIALAIDREKLPAALESGKVAALGLVPSRTPEFQPGGVKFDKFEAVKELKAAGFHAPDYLPRLSLLYVNEKHGRLAFHIRDFLRSNLGIELKLIKSTPTDFKRKLKARQFDLYLDSHWARAYPDAVEFLDLLASSNVSNHSGWKSQTYDEIIEKMRSTRDEVSRKQLFGQAQKTALEESVVIVPLYHAKTAVLLSPNVAEFELLPLLSHMYFQRIQVSGHTAN
jgi:oligopeptide transport system substrate-binding protein